MEIRNLISLLFSPSGRVNRTTYWITSFLFSVPLILVAFLEDELGTPLYWIACLVVIYPAIVIQIKRWHDRNKTGWWILINLVPFIGIWALIENGFLPGDPNENLYGLPQNVIKLQRNEVNSSS